MDLTELLDLLDTKEALIYSAAIIFVILIFICLAAYKSFRDIRKKFYLLGTTSPDLKKLYRQNKVDFFLQRARTVSYTHLGQLKGILCSYERNYFLEYLRNSIFTIISVFISVFAVLASSSSNDGSKDVITIGVIGMLCFFIFFLVASIVSNYFESKKSRLIKLLLIAIETLEQERSNT